MAEQSEKTDCNGAVRGSRRLLHTSSAFARRSLLHLQEIGEMSPPARFESRRDGLASFLFLSVEEGEGSITVGGVRHRLSAGDAALVDCRASYSHETGDVPWRFRWIHFDGPWLSEFAETLHRRADGVSVRVSSPAAYRRLWEEIWEAAAGVDTPPRDYRVNDRLCALCTLLARDAEPDRAAGDQAQSSGSATADRREARLAKVRMWIEKNCGRQIRLDDLARVAGVNKFTLVREYRARYGMPPNRAIAAARVDLAKRLLRFGDESVETVGELCGVPDPNYFARLFKRIEGIPPSEFRRRWRERS